MKFNQLCKNIKLNLLKTKIFTPDELKELCAQYNPDRFNIWKKYCLGLNDKEYLKMKYSPHVNFLIEQKYLINDTKYIQMMKEYGGKNRSKIIDVRLNNLLHMMVQIPKEGRPRHNPMILNKPLIPNKYNNGYEIWEGHHRIAVCIVTKINCPIDIYEVLTAYENPTKSKEIG